MTTAEWATRANCLGMPHPEIMWPMPSAIGHVPAAINVCTDCPVRVDCLLDGIDIGDFESVRGGLTGRQRGRAYRAFGRDIDSYPQPSAPRRWCARCHHQFDAEFDHQLERICPPCAAPRQARQAAAS